MAKMRFTWITIHKLLCFLSVFFYSTGKAEITQVCDFPLDQLVEDIPPMWWEKLPSPHPISSHTAGDLTWSIAWHWVDQCIQSRAWLLISGSTVLTCSLIAGCTSCGWAWWPVGWSTRDGQTSSTCSNTPRIRPQSAFVPDGLEKVFFFAFGCEM